ncbi:MAG TPA: hypothetical protein DCF99_05915 [Flavobacteriaceae bacterium]|nr:hypothetical protein [Flavobacteriaceae bacterium]
MEYFINENELKNYLILPKTFDWGLIDQELGFRKIFEFIPEEIYLEIKNSQPEIFRLLTKAAVHFCFVFNIPKIKVHISSTGIEQFSQEKLKTAPWWDVRDLGLALLKAGDNFFSNAIELISKNEELKNKLPFFETINDYISTPSVFNQIYSINHSVEVFSLLQPYIKQAINLKVSELIDKECFDQILEDKDLKEAFHAAIVFYALHYASLLPRFVFMQNAVVIQYEELPWQKSQVLDAQSKLIAGQNFLYLAENSLKMVTNFIKNNQDKFPCYTKGKSAYKIRAKQSGLYL